MWGTTVQHELMWGKTKYFGLIGLAVGHLSDTNRHTDKPKINYTD